MWVKLVISAASAYSKKNSLACSVQLLAENKYTMINDTYFKFRRTSENIGCIDKLSVKI